MEAYTGFAEVYDLFMDNVPYEEWASFFVEKLKIWNPGWVSMRSGLRNRQYDNAPEKSRL